MASDGGPRMRVAPREDGGITMRIGSLSLDLERAEAERLHEGIGRALMPGQPAVAEVPVDACQPVMCQLPDDCPRGPEPHPFVPPIGSFSLPCCRQPWEARTP